MTEIRTLKWLVGMFYVHINILYVRVCMWAKSWQDRAYFRLSCFTIIIEIPFLKFRCSFFTCLLPIFFQASKQKVEYRESDTHSSNVGNKNLILYRELKFISESPHPLVLSPSQVLLALNLLILQYLFISLSLTISIKRQLLCI